MTPPCSLRQRIVPLFAAAFLFFASSLWSQTLEDLKSPDTGEGLSAGAEMARFGPAAGDTAGGNPQPGYHDHGRGGNSFVNDPCLDPPPPSRARTVQSETEIAVFGKYMVVGYNDSYGFYDNTQGLSGYSYSVNGGNTWIDGSGLPPIVKTHSFFTDPASDHYFGDPVVVVDQSPRTFTLANGTTVSQHAGTFYYASLYSPPGNPAPGSIGTIAVNRGQFVAAPPQTIESVSNTRCVNDPTQQGVPDTKNLPGERIVWQPPVVAVAPVGTGASDFLDKEWMGINQATGELYVTYTRFGRDGSTPLELVRSRDGGRTWQGPFVIVPNLNDTFNTGTQPTITGTGRIVVSYLARTFALQGSGPESDNRVEVAVSDDDGVTFSANPIVVQHVNPQGEPNGYNRGRRSILNAPYITPQAHGADVYITYFNGKTPLQQGNGVIFTGRLAKQADIILAGSHDNGTTWTPVKVNDDDGMTSHIFPSAQVNKNNWVYVGWTDRRVDPTFNEFTDEWAAVSHDSGTSFGHNVEQTDVSTTWRARADAAPNFGDYNSSELLNDNQFLMTWADGRFPPGTFVPATCTPQPPNGQPCPARLSVTPDTMFTIANGLGNGK